MHAQDELASYFEQDFDSRPDLQHPFIQLWKLVHKKAGDTISRGHQNGEFLFFTIKGIQRKWFTEKNNEHTTQLSFNGELCGNSAAFLSGKASFHAVDALTDSTLFQLSKADLIAFSQENKLDYSWFEELFTKKLWKYNEELMHLLSLPMEKRFASFHAQHPSAVELVPLPYLSSFLNIEEIHLRVLLENESC